VFSCSPPSVLWGECRYAKTSYHKVDCTTFLGSWQDAMASVPALQTTWTSTWSLYESYVQSEAFLYTFRADIISWRVIWGNGMVGVVFGVNLYVVIVTVAMSFWVKHECNCIPLDENALFCFSLSHCRLSGQLNASVESRKSYQPGIQKTSIMWV